MPMIKQTNNGELLTFLIGPESYSCLALSLTNKSGSPTHLLLEVGWGNEGGKTPLFNFEKSIWKKYFSRMVVVTLHTRQCFLQTTAEGWVGRL